MIRLEVKLHCGLDWEWKRIKIVSESKSKAIETIMKMYQFRDKPYNNNVKEDSLEILEEEELETIIITDERY